MKREHYMRISPREMTHEHPDCGCLLSNTSGVEGTTLYLCTLHEAAPAMRGEIKIAIRLLTGDARKDRRQESANRLRALLAKIEANAAGNGA